MKTNFWSIITDILSNKNDNGKISFSISDIFNIFIRNNYEADVFILMLLFSPFACIGALLMWLSDERKQTISRYLVFDDYALKPYFYGFVVVVIIPLLILFFSV